jgi:hypothetical protein
VGPLAIYGYGLSNRETVLAGIRELLDRRDADPDGFGASLVPRDAGADGANDPGCA